MSVDRYLARTFGRARSRLWTYGISLLCPQQMARGVHAEAGSRGFDFHGRRAGFSLSFDVDLEADVHALPHLVAMLDELDLPTSFAVVGHWVERYPDEHRCIVDAGHEIVNHTYWHPCNVEICPDRVFSTLGVCEQIAEIDHCHHVIQDVLGVTPTGFRTPHFGELHVDSVYDVLEQLSYRYSSSVLAPASPTFGLPYEQRPGLFELPVSTCPSHPFSCFDTWHAFREPGGWHRDDHSFAEMFSRLIDMAIQYGSWVNLYFDPTNMLDDPRMARAMEHLARRRDELWIVNYQQLLETLSPALNTKRHDVQAAGV